MNGSRWKCCSDIFSSVYAHRKKNILRNDAPHSITTLIKSQTAPPNGRDLLLQPHWPRVGPDNKLYVTARSLVNPGVGYIFRFNRDLTRDQQFLISSTNISNLRRPDSPRWSNDFSALVVTSFNEPNASSPASIVVIFESGRFIYSNN